MDAAALVMVDYDPLPAVTDIREVVKDEVLLFEPSGSNTCLRIPGAGDGDAHLHAAGELPRVGSCYMCEPDQLKQRLHLLLPHFAADMFQLQPQAYIAGDGAPR